MSVFRFSDYKCIGFDLDFTILFYNTTNIAKLVYDLITNFLVEQKGYSSKYLKVPLAAQDLDFIQKGLCYDFERGNLLKITPTGKIHIASHGTKFLSNEEIEKYYPNREWEKSKLFSEEPLKMLSKPLSLSFRSSLSYFNVPGFLAFAKAVDTLDDENGEPLDKYNIWPDIQAAFRFMFSKDDFENTTGNFYSIVINNPSKYIHKCDPELLTWIQRIKDTKRKTFLITGSVFEFVNSTTSYAFGDDWKSLFDIIICYAKKPGFFKDENPFYSLKSCEEEEIIVTSSEMEVGQIYNRGNWKELLEFFSKITGVDNPRCLYVGDNLLQDIYAASVMNCDTMLVSEELMAESMLRHNISHSDECILTSKLWGSFFHLKEFDGYKDSFWNHIIKKYANICIPNIEMVISKPIDEPLSCCIQEYESKILN